MSAIYQKVRHRITDDWAFGNDVDSRPWDFEAQEFALQASINRFHHRRYAASHSLAPPPPPPPPSSQAPGQQQQQPNPHQQQPLLFEGSEAAADLLDLMEEPESSFLSVLTREIELPKQFRDNYETWMQREVFDSRIDWQQLLEATDSTACI